MIKPSEKFPYSDVLQYFCWWKEHTDVPYGYCWCGCGGRTKNAKGDDSYHGRIRGEPIRFIHNHHGMKGRPRFDGRLITERGYIMKMDWYHPFAIDRGYVREHRLVMEDHLNRYLWPWEVVHHEDEIPDNNSIENLLLFPNQSAHIAYHAIKSCVHDAICNMRSSGMSAADIARKLDICEGAAYHHIRGGGIKYLDVYDKGICNWIPNKPERAGGDR